ncbi:hypothetical protein ABZ923_40090 [Streptomyces sp. NPDC046881]|uniref:hypothetical protein n=1 Tax=Streptomyces sp. NPDC046881 TaxID=3155374 RepID=UPI00340C6E9F
MTSANERWTQRIMAGLGARPVGHAEPHNEDGPQIPMQPPARIHTPASSPGVPDWWSTKPRDLSELPDNRHPAPTAPAEPAPLQEVVKERDGGQEDEQPVQTAPAPGGPVEKVAIGGPKRTAVRKAGEKALGDRRLRIVAFNGTAAGLGWSLGLVDLFAAYLPVAEQAAVGTFGLVLAAGAGWGAWKFTGTSAVRSVFQDKTVLVRPIVTAGAAEIGRQLAPVPVQYLNAYGQEWGLGSSSASLLITAGGICGGLWWFIDRRIRHWHWTCRWLFRVPLASALLACLPYSSGPVV